VSVRLGDVTLRDGNQSLLGGALGAEELVPVAAQLDRAGFATLEVFGGATFESRLRLGSDPWTELDRLAEAAPSTRRLALVRAQSLLGPRSFADDAVDLFMRTAVAAGIGVVRLYDPLNDRRNLEAAAATARAAGASVQGALCYSVGPAHDRPYWCTQAQELEALGVDAVVVADPAGLLTPGAARELVTALTRAVSVPVGLHVHCWAGMAAMACLAALEAGAGMLDVALSPLAWGPSLPGAEAVVAALGGDHQTDVDLQRLVAASRELEPVRRRHLKDVREWGNDAEVLLHRLPWCLLEQIREHLERHNAGSRFPEALAEVERVRAELGYPPLVAPFWRMIADQAVFNVLGGERYQTVTQELKDYLQGLYGQPPRPADPGIRRLVLGYDEPITVRPADLLEPQVEQTRDQLRRRGLSDSDRDVLTYLMFPALATDLFRARTALAHRPAEAPTELQEQDLIEEAPEADVADARAEPVATQVGPATTAEFDVEVEGEVFRVRVTGAGLTVSAMPAPAPAPVSAPAAAPAPVPRARDGAIKAPMQGLIVKVPVKVGDEVALGDVVAVLEAMKMQNDIVATQPGRVLEVYVKEGDVVSPDQALVAIG
jgi:pyruvate carboxylase subunit B